LRTILNPAPADACAGEERVLRLVDVLTPNEHEAAALTAIATDGEPGTVAAAQELVRRGCGAAIVTRGAEGCVVADQDGAASLPALPVVAVDATAAGDAFNGALAVALAEGQSLSDAARWASRAAAIAVSRAGAQPSLATRAEIDAFERLHPG
jgi:ribokinase